MKLVQDAVHLLLNIHNTDPFVSDSCGFLLYIDLVVFLLNKIIDH